MQAVNFERILEQTREIARDVVAQHASSVDKDARFPSEAFEAFKRAKLLSAGVPQQWGGAGLSLAEQAQLCAVIAGQCGSSGMVLAMHYSQLACLTRHAEQSTPLQHYLQDLSEQQYLLASMTSEQGTFGNTRTSLCAVNFTSEGFTLDKDATTGSYCAQADAILVTCRRHVDAPPTDQLLVLVQKHQYTLEQTSEWDTLGMRGTCSPGFKLKAHGERWQVLDTPFADISAESMVPYSHVLWAALWSGIAHQALQRAATYVRSVARKQPGTTPHTAHMLAKAVAELQTMRQIWQETAHKFETEAENRCALHSMPWALRFNNLKVQAAEQAPKLVHQALQIVGIQGYKNDGPYAMGRAYRDVLSASLMIANERIMSKSADMLLILKDF